MGTAYPFLPSTGAVTRVKGGGATFCLASWPAMTSFDQFWLFYLREHSRAATRNLHYLGTSLLVAIALYAMFSQRWALLLAVPLAGYLFAWIGHFGIEKNRPATFKHPLWSLLADFRMWGLWLSGRLRPELERAGVDPAKP